MAARPPHSFAHQSDSLPTDEDPASKFIHDYLVNCTPGAACAPALDLSDAAKDAIARAIHHAWAPSTLEKYDNGLKHFHTFCDVEHVPDALRLPASEFLLCAFAASYAGTHAASTVEGKISAVRAWHIVNNVPFRGGLRLSYVLKGVENLSPESLPPRPPITADMLQLLYDNLDFSNPFDIAVFTAAVTAFWSQCRLGEVLSKTERSFDPTLVPRVSDLSAPCTRAGSRMLHLPCTKTKRKKGEDAFVSRQQGPTDPVSALEYHISVNKLDTSDPLFAYRTPSGGVLALTKRKFLARCNSIWSHFALPRSTGHCFRIGGTTELLLAGVAPDVVKMMGRWSSDAFLKYWRSLHRIAPLHAELLSTT